MYKRILVAVDGSENSKRAAEHAAYLATLNPGAKVEIIHVLVYDPVRAEHTYNLDNEILKANNDPRLSAIKGIFEDKKLDYDFIIKQGEPGPTIISFANRVGFDIIVIGNRGLNKFQEMILGSVSHKVAKRTDAPVLIVR